MMLKFVRDLASSAYTAPESKAGGGTARCRWPLDPDGRRRAARCRAARRSFSSRRRLLLAPMPSSVVSATPMRKLRTTTDNAAPQAHSPVDNHIEHGVWDPRTVEVRGG